MRRWARARRLAQGLPGLVCMVVGLADGGGAQRGESGQNMVRLSLLLPPRETSPRIEFDLLVAGARPA